MGRTSIRSRGSWGRPQGRGVEGIAIVSQRGGDESVVAGVMDRGIEIAIQPEDMEFLVVLVLVDSFEWNLDDSVDHLGRVGAPRGAQGSSA